MRGRRSGPTAAAVVLVAGLALGPVGADHEAADLGAGPAGWGWLGVRIRDLSELEMERTAARYGVAEGLGALVVDVVPGSPAEGAGVMQGDVIVAVAGQPVTETRVLQRLVAAAPVGRPTAVLVLRDGRRRSLDVVIARVPNRFAGERVAVELGWGLGQPGAEDAARGRAVVTRVADASAAAAAGLLTGDEVVRVSGSAVATAEAAYAALGRLPRPGRVTLTVRRAGAEVVVEIPLPGDVSAPRGR